jgi:pimeloyl-ACP methyl ester carboxylesterase
MGGMSVMACACRHPGPLAERVRGLVLVATAAHGIGARRIDRAGERAMPGDRANRLIARPRLGYALVRPTFGKAADRSHVHATRRLFVATPSRVRNDAGTAMRAMDLRAALGAVELPATVLLGRRDRLIRNDLTREIVARLPRATLVELPGAGHMLPMERPAQVVAAIAGMAGDGADRPDGHGA